MSDALIFLFFFVSFRLGAAWQIVSNIKGGLQNNKAKYIRETAEILKTKFGGKMPRTLKELQART